MILMRHGQSAFNVVYGATRRDPGIRDPALTAEGRRQAEETARALSAAGVARIVTSPYTRALQTAAIVAGALAVEVSVDPLVGERAAFSCDVGTVRSELARQWPDLGLAHLDERWWPAIEEPEHGLLRRCARFHSSMRRTSDWSGVLVVTHWGFIRGLTGQELRNGNWLRVDLETHPAPAVVAGADP